MSVPAVASFFSGPSDRAAGFQGVMRKSNFASQRWTRVNQKFGSILCWAQTSLAFIVVMYGSLLT